MRLAVDRTPVGCVRLLVDVQYPTFCLVIVKKTRKKEIWTFVPYLSLSSATRKR